MANNVKIKGLSQPILTLLKETDEIDAPFDILVQMQLIEKNIDRKVPVTDKWRKNLQEFITMLIKIIGDYFSPPNVLSEHAQKERTFAGVLVDQAKMVCSSNIPINRKTIGNIVSRLHDKFKDHLKKDLYAQTPKIKDGKLNEYLENQFYTLLSCLIVYEDPSEKTETTSAAFSGMFKIWELLHKLDELVVKNQIEEFFRFQQNRVPRNLLEITERRTRLPIQKRGLAELNAVLKEFLSGPKSITVIKLSSFCQDEEAVKNAFFQWFKDNQCKLSDNNFRLCYADVIEQVRHPNFKKDLSKRNDELESRRRLLRNQLENEWKDLQESFYPINEPTIISLSDKTNTKYRYDLKKKIVENWNEIKELQKWKSPAMIDRSLTLSNDGVPSSALECLQINLQHGEEAWRKLLERLKSSSEPSPSIDIVFIQEPYLERQSGSNYIQFPSLPKNYSVIHNIYLAKDFPQQSKGLDYYAAAILVRNDVAHQFQRIMPITAELEPGLGDSYSYQELVAGVRVRLGETSISLYSIYCRPSKSIHFLLKPFRSMESDDMSRTVICMDANACHHSWSPFKSDDSTKIGRGEDLENFRLCSGLNVARRKVVNNSSENENRWKNYKYIDVTFHGSSLSINDWEILQCDSSSDHPYIRFSIQEWSKDKNQLKASNNSGGTINPVNDHNKWTRQPQEPRRSKRLQNQRKNQK